MTDCSHLGKRRFPLAITVSWSQFYSQAQWTGGPRLIPREDDPRVRCLSNVGANRRYYMEIFEGGGITRHADRRGILLQFLLSKKKTLVPALERGEAELAAWCPESSVQYATVISRQESYSSRRSDLILKGYNKMEDSKARRWWEAKHWWQNSWWETKQNMLSNCENQCVPTVEWWGGA